MFYPIQESNNVSYGGAQSGLRYNGPTAISNAPAPLTHAQRIAQLEDQLRQLRVELEHLTGTFGTRLQELGEATGA